ncbi:hypothetical protein CDAR_439681 [Caerostris darwini]|uniref:Uncharacterized protein n=1 Tax=Caerostris darwini TaxID=1538125 RepID=A0AAV4S1S4_9ARAC|nr:hypothetical protein CDAR_439681 [Caerostris darwini]
MLLLQTCVLSYSNSQRAHLEVNLHSKHTSTSTAIVGHQEEEFEADPNGHGVERGGGEKSSRNEKSGQKQEQLQMIAEVPCEVRALHTVGFPRHRKRTSSKIFPVF